MSPSVLRDLQSPAVDVLARARDDLGRGEPWLARDRLRGTLADRPTDTAVLELLAEVHVAMNDLPAAGAAWFLTAREGDDPQVAAALQALHQRYRNPVALVDALPLRRDMSAYPVPARARIAQLQRLLAERGWRWDPPTRPRQERRRKIGHRGGAPLRPRTWRDRVGEALRTAFFAVVIVGGNIAIYVLGLVSLIRWIW